MSRVDAPLDAGPDVSREVTDALALFCQPLAHANCTAPWGCGCETFSSPPRDVAACTAAGRASCDSDFRDPLTNVFRRGGVTLDPTALDVCVAQLTRAFDLCLPPPSDDAEIPVACRDAITVGIPLGEPCEFGFRCAAGAGVCSGELCEPAPLVGESCSTFCGPGLACVDGTCGTPVPAGAACADHEDCASPELCIGGVCGAPVMLGNACTDEARCATGLVCEAGTCSSFTGSCAVGSDACGAASDCRFSGAGSRTCSPPRVTGETCDSDRQCVVGLICDFGIFPAVCQPAPALGEVCSGSCAPSLRCFDDGFGTATCQVARRIGETCNDVFSRDGRVCEDGLACVAGRCASLPRLGEPCGDDRLCDTGLSCPFDTGLCSPRVPVGGSCFDGNECAEGLFCDFGSGAATCAPIPSEGQPCPGGQCLDGLDCRFFAPLSESYCIAAPGLGEACESVCSSGVCAEDGMGACFPSVCDFVGGGGIGPPEPF